MQVTELQVQRSLEALSAGPDDRVGDGLDDHLADELEDRLGEGVPDGLVQHLVEAPAIRGDRLADARRRLWVGDRPTDEDLAQIMVGRLVCDRLR